ncbi:MAG: PQQ-dependent sugar dehydrogenase [Gemmatimonadaceae bacterium]
MRPFEIRWSVIGVSLLGAGAIAVAAWRALPAVAHTAAACDANNAGITLPAGFCATLFADSLGAARHIVVAPNGDVIVNVRSVRDAPPDRTGIFVLRDADGNGRAELKRRAAAAAGTGIALANGYVYATHGTSVLRYPYRTGALELRMADTIVREAPTGGHTAYNFVVDGPRLFLNVGSRTNSCQVQDRQLESKGVDPCVELETRAGIWSFSSQRRGQTIADGRRYATGIRNAVALARRGGDDALYVVQHGRDQLNQNWPKLFTVEQSAENPGEEFFRVTEGDDFGWPYCYYSVDHRKKVLAPEYGGDGASVGRCADKKSPLAVFPGHWAPNALLFYSGSAFPARYRNGAFIAFHGSWNRAPLPQGGFKVVFLPMSGGRAAGDFSVFADGFMPPPPSPNEPTRPVRASRPMGLAQGPDGALYISDDMGGKIWKVSYTR